MDDTTAAGKARTWQPAGLPASPHKLPAGPADHRATREALAAARRLAVALGADSGSFRSVICRLADRLTERRADVPAYARDEAQQLLERFAAVGPESMTERDVYRMAVMIALAHPRPRGQMCCAMAAPITCVCQAAYQCPAHGDTHIGGHD